MESHERQPHNVQRVSRRGFLTGGAASAVTLAYMGKIGLKHYLAEDTILEEKLDDVVADSTQPEVVPETVETSDSVYWNEYVDSFKENFKRDREIVSEKLEVIAAIQENLTLPRIQSERVRENLERLVPAMSFVESRFDAGEVSGKKAFGILQLMPRTWEEHHREDEDRDNIFDQIKVAGRLLEQTYRHIILDAELELYNIKALFFDGDEDAFANYFLTPAVIDGYHAGMERVSELIKKFLSHYPEEQSLRALSPEGKRITGHDVYYGFILTAKHEKWDEDYGDDSVEYTAKTYAANEVLIEVLMEIEENIQLVKN